MSAVAEPAKIDVRNVSKAFSDHNGARGGDGRHVVALEGVNLQIQDQEIVCIVGPSGCGKTTLLNLIAGFDTASSGEVYVSGRLVKTAGPDRALVFQSPALFPWLTVLDNVVFGARHAGVRRDRYLPSAGDLVRAVGLSGFETHYPYQLSGGMKQRVQLARSLLNNPEVLLMDEPFGPLDWQTRSEMQELLLRVWEEYHPTVLMVTHDVEEAVFVSDRVYVMTRRPGRVKMETRINLPKPRTTEIVTDAGFVQLKDEILRAIREEAQPDEEVPLADLAHREPYHP
jgi:NitT/TauT family transport system ATP-binding protein